MTPDLLASDARPRIDTRTRALATAALITLLTAIFARSVFVLWEQYDGSTSYDDVVAFGDAYWPMNVLVFGPGFAIGFGAQAVLAWFLGQGRSRAVSWIGAFIVLVGGTVFALTATAHALPFDWAAGHGVLDEPTGRIVMDAFATTGSGLLVPYIVASQLAIAVGAVVIAIGARMSGTLPTWMLVLTVLLVVAFVALPLEPGSLPEIVLGFAQAAMWALLGWFGWKAARS